MKALLIIDMQKISFTPETPRFDSEDVIKRINVLSNLFRKNEHIVIFIQHDGTKQGYCMPDTEEWKILPSLKVGASDLFISKSANDAFYKTPLKDQLIKFGVDELIITGCATDFCVDSTVKSALTNDFTVKVMADGHTTADRPNLKAAQVIAYYNWIWSEMTPTKGSIEVMDIDNFLKNEHEGETGQ